jgi:hypothetical protein
MRCCLVMHPKDLWCLVLRVLPKLLDLPHNLLKKFLNQKDEDLHELMELGTAVGNLPELPQDILMSIFTTPEIPDLVRAGSVCSSWQSAYISLANLRQYNKQQTWACCIPLNLPVKMLHAFTASWSRGYTN